jgi:DNA polymerase-3 subunit beta
MPESATLNLRLLQAINHAVSSEETRYYLCGVNVEIDTDGVTYVAMDGCIMAAIREDLPDDSPRNTLLGSWIIPSEVCKAKLTRFTDSATLTLAPRKNESPEMRLDTTAGPRVFHPVDGTFPDYRRAIPRKCDGEIAQFAPHLLARLAECARVILDGKKGDSALTPYISHNGGGPAIARWAAAPNLLGVVMPIRREEPDSLLPDWYTASAPK